MNKNQNVGDYLVSKDTDGNLQWASLEICGIPVACTSPGPVDGDTLVYNNSSGFWELVPATSTDTNIANANLLFDGHHNADLGIHRWNITRNGGTEDIIRFSPSGPKILIGDGFTVPDTGYGLPDIRGDVGQVLTMVLDGTGLTEWTYPLCAPVDCTSPGPQNGDTLIYNDSTGFWELVQATSTDTNVANTNLTLDANRTTDLDGFYPWFL